MTDDLRSDARRWARFIEIFESVPRGGPGDPASTRRALAMMPDLGADPRVLDLGCGRALTSIFLAREFGVQVWATDLWITPDHNRRRAEEAGVGDAVFPLRAEAHALLGILEGVSDEGDLWEKWDVKALAEQVGQWNEMVALRAAEIRQWFGDAVVSAL